MPPPQIHGPFWPSIQPFSLSGYMEIIKAQQQPHEAPDDDEYEEEGEEEDGDDMSTPFRPLGKPGP